MIRPLLTGLFLLFCICRVAANSRLDSLAQALEKAGSDSIACDLLNDLAWEFLEQNPDSGLYYAGRAYNLAIDINYRNGEAYALGNLGVLNEVLGNYPKAMGYYLNSVELYEELGDHELANVIRHNIGLVFAQIDDTENALKYYEKALAYDSMHNKPRDLLIDYLNIGGAYKDLGQYDKALYYYRKGLYLNKRKGHSEISFYNNMGSLFLDIKELDSAKHYLDLSIAENELTHNVLREAYDWLNLGQYLRNVGSLDSAEICLRNALELQQKTNYADVKLAGLRELSKTFAAQNKYQKALHYSALYHSFKDSILDQNRKAQVGILEQILRLEDQERLIERFETNREIDLNERKVLIIAFTLVVIISVLTVSLLWQIRLKNIKLSERNEVIEQQLVEINTLAKESHHRIKNNLQVVSSLLKLQSNHVASSSAKSALTEAYGRVRTIALIHQKLYKDDSFSKVNLEEFLHQLLSNISTSMGNEHMIVVSEDIELIWMKVDAAIFIGLIVNELVTNSFKYAFDEEEQGDIKVSIRKKGELVEIEVRDNGNGYSQEMLTEQKEAFGLNIVRSLLRIFKGQLEIFNDNGAVSKVVLNEVETLKEE